MNKAIELARNHPNIVEYVIVGNECLDQDFAGEHAVKVEQLIADINKVKQSVPANVKVTTCLGFHSGLNPEKMQDGGPNEFYRAGNDYGKRIMKESRADSLMFTVYPFYGKLPVQKGKDNTKYWYDYAVKNIANGKPVILARSAGRAMRRCSSRTRRTTMVRRFPALKMKGSTRPIWSMPSKTASSDLLSSSRRLTSLGSTIVSGSLIGGCGIRTAILNLPSLQDSESGATLEKCPFPMTIYPVDEDPAG
jgi:hypothetical protein